MRADLVSWRKTVLVFVCELVDLMGQFLHCAGPKAASRAAGALVHALAIAFDSNVGYTLSAVEKKGYLKLLEPGLRP